MKRTLQLAALVAALIIGLPLGIFIFHTGPPGISAGTDIVLARFALTNGTRLCVIGHRADSYTEPYDFRLYRTEPSGEVFVYWMGYEDSFWWRCSIRRTSDPSTLDIRAIGSVAATYNIPEHSVTMADNYYHKGVQTGFLCTNQIPLVVSGMKEQP
jgi:hypothetical protein